MMRILKIEGDHYAVGRHIGVLSKRAFRRRIMPSEAFQRLLPWRDSAWLDGVAAMTRDRLPTVYRELQGLADGCEQDFRDVLLWNCRGDLLPTGPEGCSSIAIRRAHDAVLAHNEDGDPALRADSFILDATLDGGPRLISFVYPGSIPGHTLVATSYGLAYTVNNIRLTERAEGLPRMLTARALLEARDADAFIALLRGERRAGGFHFMVADCARRVPYTVEAPLHGVAATPVETTAVHANHLVAPEFAGVEQVITASSAARQARLEELAARLGPGVGDDDLLEILDDRADAALPIYRDAPDDPDMENTLVTAVFRLTAEGVDVVIRDAPDGDVAHAAFLPSAPPKGAKRAGVACDGGV